jgi:hypothetical protein
MTALPLEADVQVHREPPLAHHAPEKSGQERPETLNFCSELEALGVGFESKCPHNSGSFSSAEALEKKFADCVAGRQTYEPEVAV